MKTTRFAALTLLFMLASFAAAGEGHPMWWWDFKGDDFIVRGEITHGDQPHIEIKWKHEGKELTTYYIRGKLKIHEVLYLDPHNRYPDNYQHYLKDLTVERDVLLLAQREYWDPMKEDDIKVSPTSFQIPKGSAIMVLNVDYVFPIGGLVLQSVVPRGKETEVMELIQGRAEQPPERDK